MRQERGSRRRPVQSLGSQKPGKRGRNIAGLVAAFGVLVATTGGARGAWEQRPVHPPCVMFASTAAIPCTVTGGGPEVASLGNAVQAYGVVRGFDSLESLQTVLAAYDFDGERAERQRLHEQLEAQLGQVGFRPIATGRFGSANGQQTDAWYDARSDMTVVCTSWATATGEAQRVWATSGKLRRGEFAPVA